MIKARIKRILGMKTPAPLIPYQQDEFLKTMKLVNPGFLHDGNLHLMDLALKNIKGDKPLVEIGSFCGLSTNILAHMLEKYNKKNPIYSVDIWKLYDYKDGEKIGGSNITHNEYRAHMMEVCRHNISFFAGKHPVYSVQAYSDDFFKTWNQQKEVQTLNGEQVATGGQISFAYIDGDHRYDQSKRDFENVDAILEPGGYILFDDSSDEIYIPDDCEVSKLIHEILLEGKYRVVGKNPNYLLQKI